MVKVSGLMGDSLYSHEFYVEPFSDDELRWAIKILSIPQWIVDEGINVVRGKGEFVTRIEKWGETAFRIFRTITMDGRQIVGDRDLYEPSGDKIALNERLRNPILMMDGRVLVMRNNVPKTDRIERRPYNLVHGGKTYLV